MNFFSPGFLARAVRTWKYCASLLCGLVFGSHTSLCLGVAFGVQNWILREILRVFRAQRLARQWVHVLHQCLALLDEFRIFPREVDSNSKVFSLRSRAEWRRVLSRCFSIQSWYGARTWKPRNYFNEVHVAGSGDDGKLVSVTACCINHCGEATHTSSRVRNNNNKNNNKNNNTIWGGSVFNRRGASTPLWGVDACSPPKQAAQPNPSYPAQCRQDTTSPWSTGYGGNS